MIDVSYRISGRSLPGEHAHALSCAVQQSLPWFAQERDAGLHLIHVAESGNGWIRPDAVPGGLIYLSRRTRLTLRIPDDRLTDAQRLSGSTLDIDGHRLSVGEHKVRSLRPARTLFSRFVVASEQDPETEFVAQVKMELQRMGVQTQILLCGKTHLIATPDERLYTRSLLVASLTPEESIALQDSGLGPGRKFGCGLFIPCKSIEPLNSADGD
jgi:CRISPR-associated protein Cas6